MQGMVFLIQSVSSTQSSFSTWFYESQGVFNGRGYSHAQAGENPELKVIFFRLCWLSRTGVSAVVVFDGPNRPKKKRGRSVRSQPHWMTQKFKDLVNAFGFYYHTVLLS